jgi:hypothetical protein
MNKQSLQENQIPIEWGKAEDDWMEANLCEKSIAVIKLRGLTSVEFLNTVTFDELIAFQIPYLEALRLKNRFFNGPNPPVWWEEGAGESKKSTEDK